MWQQKAWVRVCRQVSRKDMRAALAHQNLDDLTPPTTGMCWLAGVTRELGKPYILARKWAAGLTKIAFGPLLFETAGLL